MKHVRKERGEERGKEGGGNLKVTVSGSWNSSPSMTITKNTYAKHSTMDLISKVLH